MHRATVFVFLAILFSVAAARNDNLYDVPSRAMMVDAASRCLYDPQLAHPLGSLIGLFKGETRTLDGIDRLLALIMDAVCRKTPGACGVLLEGMPCIRCVVFRAICTDHTGIHNYCLKLDIWSDTELSL